MASNRVAAITGASPGVGRTTAAYHATETEFHGVMTRESRAARASRAFGPRQSAAQVADAIAAAIARPVPEVYPYRSSRGLVRLKAVAPGMADRLVRKIGRQAVP